MAPGHDNPKASATWELLRWRGQGHLLRLPRVLVLQWTVFALSPECPSCLGGQSSLDPGFSQVSDQQVSQR